MTKTETTYLPKAKRNAPWQMQVKCLRTIAARATAKADWFEELIGQKRDLIRMEMRVEPIDMDYIGKLEDEIADLMADISPYRVKARGAAEEMVSIAKANNDPRARRF